MKIRDKWIYLKFWKALKTKGVDEMKSQARWNKIYQKQQKRQKERELQAMLGKRPTKKERTK